MFRLGPPDNVFGITEIRDLGAYYLGTRGCGSIRDIVNRFGTAEIRRYARSKDGTRITLTGMMRSRRAVMAGLRKKNYQEQTSHGQEYENEEREPNTDGRLAVQSSDREGVKLRDREAHQRLYYELVCFGLCKSPLRLPLAAYYLSRSRFYSFLVCSFLPSLRLTQGYPYTNSFFFFLLEQASLIRSQYCSTNPLSRRATKAAERSHEIKLSNQVIYKKPPKTRTKG
ncbi:hypothetical protein BJ508DRAFT_309455 [Ascobolus immersus RN42]|uniref:Uncharacterized protein n=1 Tax=Ascobolus immersus RN42 TaxID=1160509 RepID=A0A3N4HYG0_ASCIM|nr:hypothetical protein BJ508DRAFT_309455 [Ascobolus immersus RN42]